MVFLKVKTNSLCANSRRRTYADYKTPLTNAKGYAALSIAWADEYQHLNTVSPSKVKLFWDGKIKDSKYKITTD